ncbi:tetratricopeptide repeat-containing sensor histidine kinase [Polaribacter marinivivus]|uniref:histidine kinase n=1 Tax=Polaribacter marinivivus TaxID=1524260 RepID=A0ABV8R7F2_9FLAO
MKISKKYLILIFVIGFQLTNAKSYYNREEVSKLETSSLLYQQKDSVLEKKYSEINELFNKKYYSKALTESLDFLNKLEKDDFESQYLIKNLIGTIYYNVGDEALSLKYHKEALKEISKARSYDKKVSNVFDYREAKSFHIIGSIYQRFEINDSLNLKPHLADSAKYYYKKVIRSASLNDQILDLKARTYSNLSGMYEIDSAFTLAEDYARKAIKIHRSRNNKLGEASAMNNLGNIYLSQKKYEKSRQIYFDAIELIKNQNSTKAINRKASLYYNLAWALRNLEDYKAYDNLEKFIEFSDQLRDDNMVEIIKQINGEYNVSKAKEEAEKKRILQAQRFWIFAGICVFIILSLTFYVILYYQRKRTLALRLANIDYEQKQKIDAVKSESQTRVLNATIDGKETERKEIAETLHDNVSALLSSANLHLQASRKHFKGNIPIEIYKSEQIINEASEKIRDLSHTLVSSILLKFGLTFAVKDIVDKYSNSSLQIDADVDMLRRFDQKFEIKTFNIIQEILNNVLKHSKASNAKISIKEDNDKLLIRITDDGIGFDKTKINLKDGLGINQIDARIRMMKGDFFIDSKKGFGTKVKIDLPIQEKETSISA